MRGRASLSHARAFFGADAAQIPFAENLKMDYAQDAEDEAKAGSL